MRGMFVLAPFFVASMVLLGLVPAIAAYRRGRSFLRWWVYGTFDFTDAVSQARHLQPLDNPGGTLRRCPHCRKWIQAETEACGYCKSRVTPLAKETIVAQKRAARQQLRTIDKLPAWLNR